MEAYIKVSRQMQVFLMYFVLYLCLLTCSCYETWQGRKLLSTKDPDPTTTPGNFSVNSGSSNSSSTSGSSANTIWEKIVEFYSDKNNMAMYLVLPCIILVYGGCCLIYCIAKCRKYCKNKKKHNKQKQPLMEDTDDVDTSIKERPRTPRNKVAPSTTPSNVMVSVQSQESVEEYTSTQKPQSSTKSPPPPYDYRGRRRQESTAIGGPARPAYPYQRGTPMGHSASGGRDDPAARNAEMKAYLMARHLLQFDDGVYEQGKKKRLVFTAN